MRGQELVVIGNPPYFATLATTTKISSYMICHSYWKMNRTPMTDKRTHSMASTITRFVPAGHLKALCTQLLLRMKRHFINTLRICQTIHDYLRTFEWMWRSMTCRSMHWISWRIVWALYYKCSLSALTRKLPFLRSRQLCCYSRTSQHFMEHKDSLPCSQEPSTGP
jgi:hypothetical protein